LQSVNLTIAHNFKPGSAGTPVADGKPGECGAKEYPKPKMRILSADKSRSGGGKSETGSPLMGAFNEITATSASVTLLLNLYSGFISIFEISNIPAY
jgi:hypothetical protein